MKYEPESLPELAAEALAELERDREQRRLARDDGEGPFIGNRHMRTSERGRFCLKRLPSGAWCTLDSGHDIAGRIFLATPCASSVGIALGPALPPPDRKLMTAFRAELSEKYDDKARAHPWTDRFGIAHAAGLSPARVWITRIYAR